MRCMFLDILGTTADSRDRRHNILHNNNRGWISFLHLAGRRLCTKSLLPITAKDLIDGKRDSQFPRQLHSKSRCGVNSMFGISYICTVAQAAGLVSLYPSNNRFERENDGKQRVGEVGWSAVVHVSGQGSRLPAARVV
jgi:hypothetical protein